MVVFLGLSAKQSLFVWGALFFITPYILSSWKIRTKICSSSENYRNSIQVYGQESPGWISLYKLVTFFFWKYSETSIILEKMIGQWILDRNVREITRDIKKNYFHFQNLTKNGNKVWKILKSWNDPSLLFSFAFFLVENIQNRQLKKKINWSMNSGPRWAGNC